MNYINYRVNRTSLLFKVILFLYFFFPVLDTFSGFIEHYNYSIPPVPEVIKITVLGAMCLCLIKNKKHLFFTFLIISLLIIQISYFYVFIESSNVKSNISSLVKVYFSFFSILFFYVLAKKQNEYYYFILVKVVKFTLIIISLNVFLGMLGFGSPTYKTFNYGFKGFYFAGNELSFLLVCVSTFLVWHYFNKPMVVIGLLLYSLFIGMLIGTKSASLSMVVLLMAYAFFNDSISRKMKSLLLSFCLFFLICSAFFVLSSAVSSGVISLNIQRLNSEGVISFLLSSRNIYFLQILDYLKFNSGYTSINFLLGFGRSYIGESGVSGVEMDYIDIFLWYGFIAFILCVYISTFLIYKTVKSSNHKLFLLCALVLILCLAFIAGHVFTSGIVGPMLGLYSFTITYERRRYYC